MCVRARVRAYVSSVWWAYLFLLLLPGNVVRFCACVCVRARRRVCICFRCLVGVLNLFIYLFVSMFIFINYFSVCVCVFDVYYLIPVCCHRRTDLQINLFKRQFSCPGYQCLCVPCAFIVVLMRVVIQSTVRYIFFPYVHIFFKDMTSNLCYLEC